METVIRKLEASDHKPAAGLLYASGPEALDYVFTCGKKTAIGFLEFSLRHRNGEFGFGCHRCIESGGMVCSIGAEFSGSDTWMFLINNAWQILEYYPFPASLGVMIRGIRVESVIRPPGKNVHYIAHLATAAHQRGKGLGTMLIESFIRNGKERKSRSTEIDVATDNEGALRLYLRLGFLHRSTCISTLRRNAITVPSYHRMVLDETNPSITVAKG